MKTPEEIKKGLFCCWEDGCTTCPYDEDCTMEANFEQLAKDALAYIQQLEADKAAWEDVAASPGTVEDMARENYRLTERLAQVERERDALLHDLRRADYVDCYACKHNQSSYDCDVDCANCLNPCTCNSCHHNNKWEWRGVCPENSKETSPC